MVERTVEVPSGHNVGQRFARLAAAAQMRVPCVYFGPYAAYKHGGDTQGPRYMNLRLFYAIEKMAEIEDAAMTIMRWPVDAHYEIIQTDAKNVRMRAYLNLFFENYRHGNLNELNHIIRNSAFEKEQAAERHAFIQSDVESPGQYDSPPDSVKVLSTDDVRNKYSIKGDALHLPHCIVYNVGMTYVRSDPYTGMAMLYAYLYCGGMKQHTSHLILYFPNISRRTWDQAALNPKRKDVRLYLTVADGIIFESVFEAIDSLRPPSKDPLSFALS